MSLSFRNVSKSFSGRLTLDRVSFDLKPGEVVCLLGPSGCGKSTTLRIAAGVETADAGEVRIAGTPVDGPGRFVPPERRRVGFMFQDFALFPHLSVRDNVGFGLAHLPRAERRARAGAALDRVGLARFADAYPSSLSGGEQQRLALARALAPEPDILLMDEPFSGLDERLREAVREDTLDILRERGATVLFVTHDPEEALVSADRIVMMRAGRIVADGAPETLYAAPPDLDTARFFGPLNVLHAVAGEGHVETPFGMVATGIGAGARVEVLTRPDGLRLAERGTPGLDGEVVAARRVGADTLLTVKAVQPTPDDEGGRAATLRARVRGAVPAVGARVRLAADPDALIVMPCMKPAPQP